MGNRELRPLKRSDVCSNRWSCMLGDGGSHLQLGRVPVYGELDHRSRLNDQDMLIDGHWHCENGTRLCFSFRDHYIAF